MQGSDFVFNFQSTFAGFITPFFNMLDFTIPPAPRNSLIGPPEGLRRP